MIVDTFPIADELDMLECRLREIGDVVDLVVAVEADVTHQGHPKPYHLTENLDRFARWGGKLRVVRATGLPSLDDTPDTWAREHAQRERVRDGLDGVPPDAVILHGDLDEIPTVTWAKHVKPRTFTVADMRFHPFAVDWLHHDTWPGTVAARLSLISTFSAMRDARLLAPTIPLSGWHFSWVGSHDYQVNKLGSFAHPEVERWARESIENADCYRHGYHVDGERLEAVEVDHTWPRWIADRLCPPEWFRPRIAREDVEIQAGPIVKFTC